MSESFKQSVADMPCVSVEAVLRLRERAIKLEQENAELKRQHEQAIEQLKSYEQLFKDATKAVEQNSELKRIIAESQKQKPQAYALIVDGVFNSVHRHQYDAQTEGMEIGARFNLLSLFASPVIQEGLILDASKEKKNG